jgi:hypothetical protein
MIGTKNLKKLGRLQKQDFALRRPSLRQQLLNYIRNPAWLGVCHVDLEGGNPEDFVEYTLKGLIQRQNAVSAWKSLLNGTLKEREK